MKLLCLIAMGSLLCAETTKQDRAIRKLERQQHIVERESRKSAKLSQEAKQACEEIGKTLGINQFGILGCTAPAAKAPEQAPIPATNP